MNTGRYIFSQVTDFIPRYEFDKCVARYFGDYHTRSFTCYNQFLYLLFGQLTACPSEAVPSVDLPEYELMAVDSTTISCSIKLLARALGKYSKGAVKMHTVMSLRGSIPVDIHITHGKWHDSNMLDVMNFNPNDLFVMDKAYVDFEALYRIHKAGAFFVTRA